MVALHVEPLVMQVVVQRMEIHLQTPRIRAAAEVVMEVRVDTGGLPGITLQRIAADSGEMRSQPVQPGLYWVAAVEQERSIIMMRH
jgi:hypothetical protein